MTILPEKSFSGREAIRTIRDSVSLSIATWGVIIVLVGYAIHDGVWAAMMSIWGAAMVLLGICAYVLAWWDRQ